MNANQIIAEACGWREAFPQDAPPHPDTKRGGILLPYRWINERTQERAMEVPNYFADLNAMREVEQVGIRSDKDADSYIRWLHVLCMSPMPFESMELLEQRGVIRATAAQRAEAFLRTIGKWITTP